MNRVVRTQKVHEIHQMCRTASGATFRDIIKDRERVFFCCCIFKWAEVQTLLLLLFCDGRSEENKEPVPTFWSQVVILMNSNRMAVAERSGGVCGFDHVLDEEWTYSQHGRKVPVSWIRFKKPKVGSQCREWTSAVVWENLIGSDLHHLSEGWIIPLMLQRMNLHEQAWCSENKVRHRMCAAYFFIYYNRCCVLQCKYEF